MSEDANSQPGERPEPSTRAAGKGGEAPPVVISVQGLTVVFKVGFLGRPKVAVDGASFDVHRNEIFGYIGANGAGKTTTIKTLVGLLRPTRGKVEILGHDSSDVASRRGLGFLPENPYFYEYLTAREALQFYGQLCDVPPAELKERAARLLAEVDLEHAADRHIRGYSKGMRQRLGLAQSLINDPQVVILDEPMSGLDPHGRAQVRDIILRMAERGRTVLFSSHILSDVEAICSRVCLLHQGKIQSIGELSSLLRREVKGVDLTVAGISPELASQLAADARFSRPSGVDHFFTFDGEGDAEVAARKVIEAGGRVRALHPRHESLEDLFLETTRSAAAGPVGSPTPQSPTRGATQKGGA